MLLPDVPTSGVVPSAITIEFTDYPSFMHHQTQQEQYQIACQQQQKLKQKQLASLQNRTRHDAENWHEKNYNSEEEQYPAAPLPQQLLRQQRPALGVQHPPGFYEYADGGTSTDFLYSRDGKSDPSPQTAEHALTEAAAHYGRRYEDAQGGLFSTTYASGDGRSGPPNGLASRAAATVPGSSDRRRGQDQARELEQEEKEREKQRLLQQEQQQQEQEQLELLDLGQFYGQMRQRPPHAILSARTSRTANVNASLLAPGPTAAATDAAAVSPAGSPACSSSASPPFCSPPSSSFSRRRQSQGHYHHHNILYSCHHGHQTHHPPSGHLQQLPQRRRPKTHAYSQRPASPAASAAPVLPTSPGLYTQNGHLAIQTRLPTPAPSLSATSTPFYRPLHHALAGAMDDNRPDGGDVTGSGDGYSLTTADDIAAQEIAARDYRPDLTGPCINEIRPTDEIARYYAGGDAVLAQKAANLPADYPFYRAVRGDGNCGWRAIGFCYFESLVNAGDTDQIRRERARLSELNAFIRDVGGYDPYVYEDMVEETDILFGAILDAMPDTAKAVTAVTDAFNDDSAGNAIIYHLRLLSASFLKDNVAQYEGFLAHEGGAAGYCLEFIERPNCEIDHLRMELLTHILLVPTDMFLEIAYLDRSPTHDNLAFVYVLPNSNVGRDEQTISMRISLLFRPDHYDILYRRANQAHGAANDAAQSLLPVGAGSTPGQDAAAFQHGADPQPFAAQNADLPNAPTMPTNQAMASFQSGPDDAAATAGHYAAGFGYFEALGNMLSSTVVPASSVDQGVSDLGSSLPAASPTSAVTTPALSVASHGTVPSNTDIATPPIHPPMMESQLPVGGSAKLAHSPLDPIPRTAPLAHDVQVHRVSTAPFANATQSVSRLDTYATADLSVLGFLPTMFGSYMPQQSSLFPSGPMGGSLGGALGPLGGSFGLQQTGFGDVFAPSPMAHCAPPSQMDGMSPVPSVSAASPATSTGMVDKAAAVRAGDPSTPVDEPSSRNQAGDVGAFGESFAESGAYHTTDSSALQEVPMSRTPTPSTQAEATSRPATPQGLVATGVGGFVPGPAEAHPVRFTKWHFERRPEQEPPEGSQQSAVPPRSNQRLNLAHFSNPSFRPEEYRPADDDADSARGHPGSRSRRRSRRESGAKRADREKGT